MNWEYKIYVHVRCGSHTIAYNTTFLMTLYEMPNNVRAPPRQLEGPARERRVGTIIASTIKSIIRERPLVAAPLLRKHSNPTMDIPLRCKCVVLEALILPACGVRLLALGELQYQAMKCHHIRAIHRSTYM